MSTNTRARQQCIAFNALYVSQMTQYYSKALYSMYMYSYILGFGFFLIKKFPIQCKQLCHLPVLDLREPYTNATLLSFSFFLNKKITTS